ncbi:MAG TPA: hypothetical protein VGV64_06445, partial [Thermoplasmata archaeon]|nr:hypothetical protein [Thermoplasmata archaeon]
MALKVGIDRREAFSGSVDVVVSGVAERSEKEEGFPRGLAVEDGASQGVLQAAWRRKEIRGRRKELTTIHRPDGKGRIALLGLG